MIAFFFVDSMVAEKRLKICKNIIDKPKKTDSNPKILL